MSIEYDYYPIDATNITNALENGISASFIGRNNQPNLVFTEDTGSSNYYRTDKLYISGTSSLLHQEREHDGELIIEHYDIMGFSRIYTILLLVSGNGKHTSIDDLIDGTDSKTLDKSCLFSSLFSISVPSGRTKNIELNTFIARSSTNTYQTKNNEAVFVFTEPVAIHTDIRNKYNDFFTKKRTSGLFVIQEGSSNMADGDFEGDMKATISHNKNYLADMDNKAKLEASNDGDGSDELYSTRLNNYVAKSGENANLYAKSVVPEENAVLPVSSDANSGGNINDTKEVSLPPGTNLQCDYVDVDQHDMVQMLQIPMDENYFNFIAKLNESALLNVIFVSIGILSLLILSPTIHNILKEVACTFGKEGDVCLSDVRVLQWDKSPTRLDCIIYGIPTIAAIILLLLGQFINKVFFIVAFIILISLVVFYLGTNMNTH